jgi:ABC-type amino acid transport substrate-binding protein
MQFNAGLVQLQQSGRYQDILASYRQVEATP